MKRIDLHVHTKEMFDGDGVNRNIDPPDFKKKMVDNKIGIVAITNHNHFEKEYYEKFISENFEVLPGVEIDVEYESKRKQLNLIVPQSQAEKLEKFIEEHKPSSQKPLKFQTLVDEFDQKNSVFYLDYKNKNRWDYKQIEDVQKKYVKKGIVIADSNNGKTQFILQSNKFLSLIGSDVKNWDKYDDDDVPRLLSTNIEPLTFDQMTKLLKYDESSIRQILENQINIYKFEKFWIDKEKNLYINNLEIKKGVNVIFGPKATGKTKILEALYSKNKNTSIIYRSKNFENSFEEMKEIEKALSQNEEDRIKNIEEVLESIENYKELKYKIFGNFYKGIKSKAKIKITKVKIQNISESHFKQIKKIGKKVVNLVAEIQKQKFQNLNPEMFSKKFHYIAENIWQEYIEENKAFLKSKFIKEMIEEIKIIQNTMKADVVVPQRVGLFDRWNNRQKLITKISELKNMNFESADTIREFEIPERTSTKLVRKFRTLPFGKRIKDNFFDKLKIKTNYNNIFMKLFSLKYQSSDKKILEVISSIKELSNENSLENNFNYFKTKLYKINNDFFNADDNKKSDFSNGEKVYIVLNHLLQSDKEIFLLDEPSTFLESKIISKNILQKIGDLKEREKTIVMTTHSSTLGINSIPNNMIFRQNQFLPNSKNYKTFSGNFLSRKLFLTNELIENIELKKILLENFEGGEKHYIFRKDIYDF